MLVIRVLFAWFRVPADRAGVPARERQARHFLGGGKNSYRYRRRAALGVSRLSQNVCHRRGVILQLHDILFYHVLRTSQRYSFHTYE